MKRLLSVVLPCLALLGGCAVLETPIPGIPQETVAASKDAVNATEFDLEKANVLTPMRLQRDDSVKLVVMGYPELTHVAAVQRDGKASFPLIGEVAAANRSISEVREEVFKRLTEQTTSAPVRIEPDDQLRFAVWRQPTLTHVATVQSDGRATFPLIGEVAAAGRTLAEIREEAQTRLAQFLREPQVSIMPERMRRRALVNPQISLLPEKVRERRVAVLGEVLLPGMYPISGGLRVMDVLAQSRYRTDVDLNSVVVIRDATGKAPQYRMLRLGDYSEGKAPNQNIYLSDEDIVFVPRSLIVKIGDFIEKFFTRTRPVFDWWTALQNARYAEDAAKLNQRLFQLLQ